MRLAFCASLAFIFHLSPFTLQAQWDGTSAPWTQGTGTAFSPYRISTPQQLAYLADMVNAGVGTYRNAHYVLTDDISLSNLPWTPIGDTLNPFMGTFDGGGHTINDVLFGTNSYTCVGLFGKVQNGTIKNLTCSVRITDIDRVMDNLYYTQNNHYIGGICGHMADGTIHNCKHNGIISDTTSINQSCDFNQYSEGYRYLYIGGIVGYITANGTVSQCINNGDIVLFNSETYHLTISNYGAGLHDGIVRVAGVAGFMRSGTVKLCGNKGDITVSGYYWSWYSSGYGGYTGNGPLTISGVANGEKQTANYIHYCYNTGDLTAVLFYPYYYSNYSSGHTSSYTAKVFVCGVGNGQDLHESTSASTYIKNCYNAGDLTAVSQDNESIYGVAKSSMTNCYFRNDCGATEGGNSRTEAAMKSVGFPLMLNSDSTVFITDYSNSNNGYPVFLYTLDNSVATVDVTNLGSYNATLNGQYEYADSVGFIYGQVGSAFSRASVSSTSTTVSHTLNNLQPNTQYRYAFYTCAANRYYYGDTLTFTTHPLCTVSVASSDTSMGTVSGGGSYGYGEVATLVATPKPHYGLWNWNDGDTTNPRLVTVTSDTSFTAHFGLRRCRVVAVANDSIRGTVSGGGIFNYGETTILLAAPNTGYYFTQWSDGVSDNPRTVNIESDTTFYAIFTPYRYTVSLLSSDASLGIVNGGGQYDYGQQAHIVATPTGGYFMQWSDGNQEADRYITVTGNIALTAIFTNLTYTITALSSDNTAGTVTGGGSYPFGRQVVLTAIPAAGYYFQHWTDGNTDNPRTVTVYGDATYIAQFLGETYNVSVVTADPVAGDVSGGGTYNYGQQITITATANHGYRFSRWKNGSDTIYTTENPRTVTITQDTTFTAYFVTHPEYLVNVVVQPEGAGTVDGAGYYEPGQTATLTANAVGENIFEEWIIDGGDTRWDNPTSIVVDHDINVIAFFWSITGIAEPGSTDIPVRITTNGRTVTITGDEWQSLAIYDILGRKVAQSTSHLSPLTIHLPQAGVYLLRVDGNIIKKIVII